MGTVYGVPMAAFVDPSTLYLSIEETQSVSTTNIRYMIKTNGKVALITGVEIDPHLVKPGSAIYIDLPSPLVGSTIKNVAIVESVSWEAPDRIIVKPLNEDTVLETALGLDI